MLTSAQRAIITATVPLLETGGAALTAHFYRSLLAQYAEVRPLFNTANQASGDQARALANGILAYARHIDKLDELGDMVGRIVSKHVGLQVLPEHYPLVGKCLLASIREVLGADIATDEVIAAWAAAYGQLADILIAHEEARYAASETQPGGWRGARVFRVARRENESAEIVSFILEAADGGALIDYLPGQYLGLRLTIGGEEIRRNYSLSAAPNGRTYRISVKREPQGLVSNYLHDNLQEGALIDVFPPAGAFTLTDSDKPLVLISGGVGITPTLAMLEAAAPSQREIRFIHCARGAAVHAFVDAVDRLAAGRDNIKQFYVYENPEEIDGAGVRAHAFGYLNRALLEKWLPATRDVDAYFLGPKPFMRAVKHALKELGVPEAQSRYEFFGPPAELA